MSNKNYEITLDNIFKDLALEQPEELMARAKLLQKVSILIKNSKLSQKKLGVILGISQPKVSLLFSGKLSAFTTETLLRYLSLLGCNIDIRIQKPKSPVKIKRRKGRIAVK